MEWLALQLSSAGLHAWVELDTVVLWAAFVVELVRRAMRR